jgi:hypothetical protein
MFEGVNSRVSFLLPLLEPACVQRMPLRGCCAAHGCAMRRYVADQIVSAIRLNKERIILPKICVIVRLLCPGEGGIC